MKILGFESSAKAASVALTEDGKLLSQEISEGLPQIFFHLCLISLSDLGKVC